MGCIGFHTEHVAHRPHGKHLLFKIGARLILSESLAHAMWRVLANGAVDVLVFLAKPQERCKGPSGGVRVPALGRDAPSSIHNVKAIERVAMISLETSKQSG
eukprot:6425298-Prymnesium_polylepis.2